MPLIIGEIPKIPFDDSIVDKVYDRLTDLAKKHVSRENVMAVLAAIGNPDMPPVTAEPDQWQSRYAGDPRQKGAWDAVSVWRPEALAWAKAIYAMPGHTDGTFEIRALYAREYAPRS